MNDSISATINDHQSLPITITPKDRDGDVVAVENAIWTSSDESICTVESTPDGLSCLASSTGKVGECTITCAADADLGDGVQSIQQECHITVVQSNADSLNMSAGLPVERDEDEVSTPGVPPAEPPVEGGGSSGPGSGEPVIPSFTEG